MYIYMYICIYVCMYEVVVGCALSCSNSESISSLIKFIFHTATVAVADRNAQSTFSHPGYRVKVSLTLLLLFLQLFSLSLLIHTAAIVTRQMCVQRSGACTGSAPAGRVG